MTAPEVRTPGGTRANAEQQNTNAHILGAPPSIVNDVGPDRQAKDTATLIAKFALAGHSVHPGNDGDFLVSKYGLSRWCENLAELREFAKKLRVKL